MNIVGFNEAISEIARTCGQAKKRDEPSPYVFVVGAGISYPSVPLASEIEKHCREEAEQIGITVPPADDTAMGRYSHWFSKAYPNPHDRQRYLESLIEKKPISVANFRLAHLLLDNSVTNLVVTPNFDDFLSQALTILGRRNFRVCDHPETVDRIDPTGLETQIVHVHGTYWFYDQANLSGEIRSRAKGSETTVFSMAHLIDSIFLKHSPIVVGYSGWEGDVIMRALKRRLTRRLEYRMYWFCHRRDAIEALPSELKEHQEVWLVLPPERAETPETRDPESPMRALTTLTEAMTAVRVGSQIPLQVESRFDPPKADATIDAQTVFGELIAARNVEAPKLLRDPLSFFADQFQLSMPQESSGSEGAPYSFASVLTRIRDAQEWEEQCRRKKTDLLLLGAVQEAVARSSYVEAIQKAHTISVESLEEPQRKELIHSLSFAMDNLSSAPEEEIRGANLIIAVSDSLSQAVRDDQAVAIALLRKGRTLGELGRREEAVAAYDEMVRRFGEASEPVLRTRLAMGLFDKGVTLVQLERNEEAIGAYDEVVRRFGNAEETALQQQVARALVNKGWTLKQLGRGEDAIAIYDEVVRRFGEAKATALRDQVARALTNKAVALWKPESRETVLGIFDEVLRRFDDVSGVAFREYVAGALSSKGVILWVLGRSEEGLHAYDELIRRFGEETELELRELVADALVNKGMILDALGRSEEALGVYEEVMRRFGKASELALRESVAEALVKKGTTLRQSERTGEAMEAFSEVERRFGEAGEGKLAELVSQARTAKAKLSEAQE